jgi:hypothetical protein
MCALTIRAAHDVNRCLVDALQDGGSGIIGCEGLEGMSCTWLRDGYPRRIQNRGISFFFRYISAV